MSSTKKSKSTSQNTSEQDNTKQKTSKKGKSSVWQKHVVDWIIRPIVKSIINEAPNVISKLKNWWHGKSIGVLGATATGKNSLFNRLKDDNFSENYIQTRGTENIKTFKVSYRLNDKDYIEFKCKNSVNVGGETDERERYWGDILKNSDILFYLIDIEKVAKQSNSYMERLQDDLLWLHACCSKMKNGAKIYIILNKIDVLIGDCKKNGLNEEMISKSIEEPIGNVSNIIEDIFGILDNGDIDGISGVYPISIKDKNLFHKYFKQIIKDIYEKENKK